VTNTIVRGKGLGAYDIPYPPHTAQPADGRQPTMTDDMRSTRGAAEYFPYAWNLAVTPSHSWNLETT
jgi:hypothetical protein